MTSSVYPAISDFDRFAADLAPSVLRREPTWSFVLTLMQPLSVLDQQNAEIARTLDPTVAGGRWLDYCGARVGEDRGGLGDTEFRRIILARQAAGVARGTIDGVWACWQALTGCDEATGRMYVVPVPGKPTVYLEGEVQFTPTRAFVERSAVVISAAVVAGTDVSAHFYAPNAARPGRLPGGGLGTGAWTLPT